VVVFYYFSFSLLIETEGFAYEPRSRDTLPDGFPDDVKGISYFLDSFTHPKAPKDDMNFDHIARGMADNRMILDGNT